MSFLPPSKLQLKPSSVKRDQHQGVDINRLVASQTARISLPVPIYPDLTTLPRSRGEVAVRISELQYQLPPALRAMTFSELAALSPAQLQALINPAPSAAPPPGIAPSARSTSAAQPPAGSAGSSTPTTLAPNNTGEGSAS